MDMNDLQKFKNLFDEVGIGYKELKNIRTGRTWLCIDQNNVRETSYYIDVEFTPSGKFVCFDPYG